MAKLIINYEEAELIELNLKSTTNHYILFYVVEDDAAKERLDERLRFIQNKRDIQVVVLDIMSATRDQIHGPVVIGSKGPFSERPEWFKNEPFMLLIQNIEKLSAQNPDDLTKLNKLAYYLPPTFGSLPGQVPVTLGENALIAAIIAESNQENINSIVRHLGSNAQQAIKAIKVRENNEGRWERYS